MSELVIISLDEIVEANYAFTYINCEDRRRELVKSCYSSFYYYDTPQQQIASIVISLVKGHFFVDGNKRTGLFTYIILSQLNGIQYIEDEEEQARILVEIASSHLSIQEYAQKLFHN